MSFSLGQAKLILNLDAQPLIEQEAVAWKATRQGAQAVTQFLAKENNVRVTDVKKAATIIIDENKKAAREILKAEKALADDRKKTTQAYIASNKQQIKEEEAAARQAAKAKADAEKAAANDRKKTTQELLSYNKRIIKEEEAERRKLEATLKQLDRERERSAQQASRLDILNLKRASAEKKAIAQQEARDAAAAQKQQGSAGILGSGVSGAKFGATAATLLGFGAIASGALVAREALLGLVEATTKQDQAQRSLNAAFGEGAARQKEISAAYAAQFGIVTSTVDKALATFGTLDKQTNLTSEQIKRLTERAIDLQAAFGGDLQEAFRSTAGVILGETEAAEKYGVVLQDGVLKTLPQLTEFQRRNFETLSEGEKQQIRYNLFLELTAKAQGAATQKAQEAQGQFQAFGRSMDELAKSAGEKLVPALGGIVGGVGAGIDAVTRQIAIFNEFIDTINSVDKIRSISQLRERAESNRRIKQINDEVKAEKEAHQALIRDRQKEEKERVEIDNANVKRRADIIVEELKRSHAAEVIRIEDAKRAAEAQQRIALDLLETRHKAEIVALEATEYARKQASADELARIEKEKDVAIQAAEDKKEAAIKALDAERDAVQDATKENIRQQEIARDERLRGIEQTKQAALDLAQTERRAQQAARIGENRIIEDQIEKEDRARDDGHKRNVRRIEDEGDKLREKYEDETERIDRLGDKEDDRHTKRVRQIQDEQKASEEYGQSQIDLIQQQIDLLDAQKKAEDNRRRNRDLTQKLDDARQNLTRVQGRGTPEEIAAARSNLVGALRIGNPEAVKKAQADLTEVTGRGAEAIAAAQRGVFEAEQDLRDESVDQTRDAEKDKLEAAKDAITEQTKIKKVNLDKQVQDEQRAEEDRTKRRKQALDADKNAAKDRLDDALKKLDKRKDAEADTYESDKRGAKDAAETASRILADRRRVEDEAHDDRIEQINEEAKSNIEATHAIYDDEKTGTIPALRRALDAYNRTYDERKAKAEEVYKDERKQIYDTYDDPVNGLLAKYRQAEEAAQRSYSLQVAAANARYDAEKEKVQRTYRALDGKSGILDQYDEQLRVAKEKLDDNLKQWEDWSKDLVGPNGITTKAWAQILAEYDKFIQDIKNRGGVTIKPRIIVDVTNRQTSNSPNTGGSDDPGLPGGLDNSGGPGDRGAGSTSIPTGVGNTGSQSAQSSPASFDPNDYAVTFGWKQRYSGGYPAAPGWDGGNSAAWTNGPSRHKGIDLSTKQGIGGPVVAFAEGRVVSTHSFSGNPDKDPGGNYIVIEGSGGLTHWYMHLGSMNPPADGMVKRGTLIGTQGWSGLDSPGDSHIHYEVRTGFNNGPMSLADLERDGIDPRPYINGNRRDAGYLFNNPTIYRDMVTGERGVMAERAPERLLGSAETRRYDGGSHNPGYDWGNIDYSSIGSALISAGGRSNSVTDTGDTLNYYGVAPESLIRDWRSDQKRRSLLRGVSGLVRNG